MKTWLLIYSLKLSNNESCLFDSVTWNANNLRVFYFILSINISKSLQIIFFKESKTKILIVKTIDWENLFELVKDDISLTSGWHQT